MNIARLFSVLVGSLTSAALAQQVKPLATQPTAAEPSTRPFVVGEAKLPAGFPAPSEVGKVVVKSYPAYRAARVTSDQAGGQNKMFGTLFRHIQTNEIKMTAPVEMTFAPDGAADASKKLAADEEPVTASMSFLYADPALGKIGRDGDVDVIDVPAARVVSIGVRGSYTRETFDRAVVTLREFLATRPDLSASAPPRYLGYNSPFVPPPMRYGEVQIEVVETGNK